MLLVKIFSREYSTIQVIDFILFILLVLWLYRLVRGTLGFNIFLGFFIIYLVYYILKFFKLPILTELLAQFVNAGVIAILIVFQPEIRRFLLQLGKISLGNRENWSRIVGYNRRQRSRQQENDISEIVSALQYFSENRTGALLVFFRTFRLTDLSNPGVKINGAISAKLLESIFDKSSPLHDGAVLISHNKIVFAGTVLPLSEGGNVPPRSGLRHRAAIGITEQTDAVAIAVSEETGVISCAKDGKIKTNLTSDELRQIVHDEIVE